MRTRYAQWMYDWESRLTSLDNNRIVRPLEWGVEWAADWPCRNGLPAGQVPGNPERFFSEYNQRIIADSDEFYSYREPSDFRLDRREVQVFSTREVPDAKLEAMTAELMRLVGGLSLETLLDHAGAADDPSRTAGP